MRSKIIFRSPLLLFSWVWLVACAPLAPDDASVAPVRVAVEPDGALDRAPPVLRLRVTGGESLDPDDVFLVEGEVSSSQLSQLARNDPSNALVERFVPALRWQEDAAVVVAPTVPLPPERYSLVVGSSRETVEITVVEDELPVLRHVWPPEGVGFGHTLSVWCGDTPLPPLSTRVTLEPGGIETRLEDGASDIGVGANCVHIAVPPVARSVVAPPALMAGPGAPFARLAPVELRVDGDPPTVEALSCPLGELPLGAGCVQDVADDRFVLAPPEATLLWLFTDGRQLDLVAPSTGGSFLVHPLVPNTPVDVTWQMLDASGQGPAGLLRVFTTMPRAHLVITEVLANPIGPEPEQEYVEIYNDGLAPAQLGDYTLFDIGGETPLPMGLVLMPGRFALVVNDDYDMAAEYDPTPVEGTVIVRVEHLGAGGLKNDGEPLKLGDAHGVVSRFPALPKPQSGVSVQRLHARVASDDAAGFVRGEPTPGAPYRVKRE